MQRCVHLEELIKGGSNTEQVIGIGHLMTVPYLGNVLVCEECEEELAERFLRRVIALEPPAGVAMG